MNDEALESFMAGLIDYRARASITPAELATLRDLRAGRLVAVEAAAFDCLQDLAANAEGGRAFLEKAFPAPPDAKEEGNG